MSKAICHFCNKKFNATKKHTRTCSDICFTKQWKRDERKEKKFHKENKKSTVSWKIEFENGIEVNIPQKLVQRQKTYGHLVEMHPDEGFKCIVRSGALGLMFRMYDGSTIFVEGTKENMKASTFIEREPINRKPYPKRRNKK